MTNPKIQFSKSQARRFLLNYHNLLPPRQLNGKQAILDIVKRVGSVQYDPVNIVGSNPELFFQSRIKDFRPSMLEDLLYKDKRLLDGWDKMASLYLCEDRSYFERHRERMRKEHDYPAGRVPHEITNHVIEQIKNKGPLCSLDLERQGRMDWFWGVPVRAERAALENLYAMGHLGIEHRNGSRRYFDLIEKLLPKERLNAPDPNPSLEKYQEWHVLRRIGGLGLANLGAGEHWGGIMGVKSHRRQEILNILEKAGSITQVAIEGLDARKFYLRTADLEQLRTVENQEPPSLAAVLAPLDNLLWDRDLVRWVFDFDYTWEVYKPAHLRKYGHYTLPILFGDRFIARFEPVRDKKNKCLVIKGWWWEGKGEINPLVTAALINCLRDFMEYLGFVKVQTSEQLLLKLDLAFLKDI